MKNFDQWTEALARDLYTQSDEENVKVLWKTDDFFDEDIEDED